MRAALPALIVAVVSLAACFSSSAPADATLDAGYADATFDSPGEPSRDAQLGDAEGGSDTAVPDVGTPDAGPTCSLAVGAPLALPHEMVSGTLAGASMSRMASCGVDPTGGPETVHPLHISTRTGVVLTVDSASEIILAIRTVCEQASSEVACVAAPDSGGSTPTLRTVLEPGDYFVLVDVYRFGTGGDYTLTLDTFATLANDTCASAMTVTDGTHLTGEDIAPAAATMFECPGETASPTGLLYYRATVPAGQRLIFTATSPDDLPMSLRLADACTPTACFYSGSDHRRVVYENVDGAPRDVVVVVGPRSSGTAFDADVAIQPVAANVTCATAQVVSDGDHVTGDTGLGTATAAPRTCFTGVPPDPPGYPPIGGLLWYRATVPPGDTIGVATHRTGPFFGLGLGMLDACESATCLARSSGSPTWTNTDTVVHDVVFYVGSFDDPGAFDMDVSIGPPATNTICADAIRVGDGTSLEFQDAAAAGSPSLASLCESDVTQGSLYYYATVPPGSRLVASVSPYSRDEIGLVLRLLNGCAAFDCLASGRPDPYFRNSRVEYTNRGGVAVDVVLAVSQGWSGGARYFYLDTELGRPPYVETAVRGICTDVTGGTMLAGIAMTDDHSAVLALPFAFTYFGVPVTHYTVYADGFVQLHTSDAGAPPVFGGTNTILPSPLPPNGIVAPFWDDLTPGAAGRVRALTTGVPPNRVFVVDWTNFALASDAGSALRFQAKLFETTGAIELAYCSLLPTLDAVSGSGASVGLESIDGLEGSEHSFNRAMSVSSALAYNFVPRP